MLDAQSPMTTWPKSPAQHRRAQHQVQASIFAYELAKRALDIVLAFCLLVLFSPLMLLTAVAIKLDSHGPIFFVQSRTGRYGKRFKVYKFRSMSYSEDHTTAHREFMRQYANGNGDSEAYNSLYKPASNGRVITRMGRWLRLSSLDELPQLWNILKGDMSLVGPRAWPDYELENYKEWQYRRLDVTPGLTGLAQINGRSSLSFDAIIRLDLEYIEQRSLWLDLKILLKTIPVVITGANAG